jgi:hypothetical protein
MKSLLFALITIALLSTPAISQDMKHMKDMDHMDGMKEKGMEGMEGMNEKGMEAMACM